MLLFTVKSKLSSLSSAVAGVLLLSCPNASSAQSTIGESQLPATVGRSTWASPDPQNGAGQEGRLFIIGHLRADPESPLVPEVFDRLREFLTRLPAVREAMYQEGVSSIEVQSADSENILVDWMNQEQLDIVFPPAMAFTRQTGRYRPVYQLSRPGLDLVAPGGERVVQRGAVFVNNRSPLFSAPGTGRLSEEFLRRELPRYLAGRPIAFVSSFSAAGYYYPFLSLANLTSNTQPQLQNTYFCASSEEVVKSVINGVYEIGACNRGVIDRVLASGPPGLLEQKDQLVRVILETDPIPTDPVCFLQRWHPPGGSGTAPSPLGREIRNGIKAFFEQNRQLPRLMPSPPDTYRELEQTRDDLHEMLRQRETPTPAK